MMKIMGCVLSWVPAHAHRPIKDIHLRNDSMRYTSTFSEKRRIAGLLETTQSLAHIMESQHHLFNSGQLSSHTYVNVDEGAICQLFPLSLCRKKSIINIDDISNCKTASQVSPRADEHDIKAQAGICVQHATSNMRRLSTTPPENRASTALAFREQLVVSWFMLGLPEMKGHRFNTQWRFLGWGIWWTIAPCFEWFIRTADCCVAFSSSIFKLHQLIIELQVVQVVPMFPAANRQAWPWGAAAVMLQFCRIFYCFEKILRRLHVKRGARAHLSTYSRLENVFAQRQRTPAQKESVRSANHNPPALCIANSQVNLSQKERLSTCENYLTPNFFWSSSQVLEAKCGIGQRISACLR